MNLILNVYLQYSLLGVFETTGGLMVTHIDIYEHVHVNVKKAKVWY